MGFARVQQAKKRITKPDTDGGDGTSGDGTSGDGALYLDHSA